MLSFILRGCTDCDSLDDAICAVDATLASYGKNALQNVSFLTNRPLPRMETRRLIYYRELLNNLKWDQSFYTPFCFPDIVSRAEGLADKYVPIQKRFTLPTFTTTTSTTTTSTTTLSPVSWVGRTVVFVGDSITAGQGASSPSLRWTTLASVYKGATEVNMGIGGEVLQSGSGCSNTVFDKTTIPIKTPTHLYLFIALGTNDVGINNGIMTSTLFQSTLSTTVDYAVSTKGWAYSDIIIMSSFYASVTGYNSYVGVCSVVTPATPTRAFQYEAAAQAVAIAKGCKYLPIYTIMFNNPIRDLCLGPSGLHPNDLGYSFIAGVIESSF